MLLFLGHKPSLLAGSPSLVLAPFLCKTQIPLPLIVPPESIDCAFDHPHQLTLDLVLFFILPSNSLSKVCL